MKKLNFEQMEKEEIIRKLKANRYCFEEKNEQIVVKLTGRCRFIIALNQEQLMSYGEIIRSAVFVKKNVSLKSEARYIIISTAVLILFSIGWNFIDEVFLMEFNVFFITTLGMFLGSVIPMIYCYKRIVRVKKLLNLV